MDSELEAMQSVYAALHELDEAAQARVLAWAASKFGVQPAMGNATEGAGGNGATGAGTEVVASSYTSVGDLVDAAQPVDGPERALVVGYFFQEIEGRDGFGGADVNNALKNLGHPLANVTKTLTSLRIRKPALVMQVGKSGRSAQSRKTYKLTAAGVKEVRHMLGRGLPEEAA